jgi:hypothetical protein
MTDELLIATATFVSVHDGHDEWVHAGEIAEMDAWPVKAHPNAFQPLEVRWKGPKSRRAQLDGSSPAISPATIRKRGGGRRPRNDA